MQLRRLGPAHEHVGERQRHHHHQRDRRASAQARRPGAARQDRPVPRRHHVARGRRHRQRRQRVPHGRRRHRRRHPLRRRAAAQRGVPAARGLRDRRDEDHEGVLPPREAHPPHRRPHRSRRPAAALVLPHVPRTRRTAQPAVSRVLLRRHRHLQLPARPRDAHRPERDAQVARRDQDAAHRRFEGLQPRVARLHRLLLLQGDRAHGVRAPRAKLLPAQRRLPRLGASRARRGRAG
mmetsp:Transcript_10191/g.31437  ORF Transcript_10191/g.31437 Transcript_10191/m.31437 type:complete len:236 (+) Transcript_10191:85-792(+)